MKLSKLSEQNMTIVNGKSIYIFILILFLNINCFGQSWKEAFDKAGDYISQKNYSAAVTYIEKAISEAEKDIGKTDKNYAKILGRAGEIHYMAGDFNRAIEYLNREKEIFVKHIGTDDASYATVIHNLSTILQSLGRYRDAEPLLIEAIDIKKAKVGTNDTSYAKSLNNLAVNYQNLGNYEKAEKYYMEALRIKEGQFKSDNPSIGLSLASLGALYVALGNNEVAIEYYERALAIFNKSYGENNSNTIQVESKLAILYIGTGDLKKAEPLLKKVEDYQTNSIGKNHPDYAQTQYNLGILQWELKNYREAEKLIKEAKNIINTRMGQGHPLYSSCLNALGTICWHRGDLEGAYSYFTEATYLKEQLFGENHPDFAIMLHNLAGVLKDMGQYETAEKNYKKAFNLYAKQLREYFPFLSDNEKARYYTKMKEKFDMFNCYVLQRGADNPKLIGDMYNYHIAIKAILLNSTKKVRRIISESSDNDLKKSFTEWMNIKNDLSHLYNLPVYELKRTGANIDSLEKIVNKLEKYISKKSTQFEKEYDKKIVQWTEIRDLLKKDEAAIEIIRFNFFRNGQWTDTVFYAALIITSETVDSPEMVVFNNGYDLEKFYIKNYKNSIRYQIDDNDSYAAFWGKIDEKLQGKTKIYISKDGVFNKLNVNTLLKPDGSYVIDDKNIFIVSNTKDLVINKMKKEDRSGPKNAMLFGHPSYNIPDIKSAVPPDEKLNIADLFGTRFEIEKIDSILNSKSWHTNVYMENDANEEAFKKIQEADVIHVATHGFFRKKSDEEYHTDLSNTGLTNPLLNSGLLFTGSANWLGLDKDYSPETGENGILTAYEAMNLSLEDTKLVVLSACETGLGEIKNGEGVYGLQRAFEVAGAQSIIMSIWKVHDLATQELMVDFYRYWLNGDKIYDAFRKAQLDIKQRYPHPYFWGAFVIIGAQR